MADTERTSTESKGRELKKEMLSAWRPEYHEITVPKVVALGAVGALVSLYWMPTWLVLATLLFAYSLLLAFGNQAYYRSAKDTPDVAYKFTFKSQFSTQCNILTGITLGQWLEILRNRWRHVDWRIYGFRVFFLTGMATFNSVLSSFEHFLYGKSVANVKLNEEPVFILGHPRTGTTHLFNLLSLDDDQFIYPNTFQCGFANAIQLLGNKTFLFQGALSDTRPMDNVKLTFDAPQEDELGINVITAGTSPYMPLMFMNREPEFRRFFTFEDATEEERTRWVAGFFEFMRRVTADYIARGAKTNRMIFKSPCHVARARLFYQLFPKAQFIYIHRNPFTVWKSAAHMADTTYWHTYLAKPTDEMVTEFILSQYETLFKEYQAARSMIPSEQFAVVSYDQLDDNPLQTLHGIYEKFGWKTWDSAEPRLKSYLASLGTFKKNNFTPVPEPMKSYVLKRWKPSFDEFGYNEKDERDQKAASPEGRSADKY